MSAIDSVLLVAFGGPTRRTEIRPFLEIVTRGRRIPPERLEEVAHHYESMPGGCSPLNALTEAQAEGLRRALAGEGRTLPVFVGMRNWHPFLHETLGAMIAAGHRRALVIILSTFRTEASWERYVADVESARGRTPRALDLEFAAPWFEHPRFITAAADGVARALAALSPGERADTPLVFTAHSVPVAMAAASPYVADFTAAARAVAARIGPARWSLAYQSRSGSPRDPWLEPDIGDAVKALAKEGARHVVVSPIGFVCDHVEVLYDLDVEARGIAQAHGVTFQRAPAVNAHPEFIAMLADIVRSHAAPGAGHPRHEPDSRDPLQ
jgi:protoporphyrin/coproporphyrin ferrochelatase